MSDAPVLGAGGEAGERFVRSRGLPAARHQQGRVPAVPCGEAFQRDLGAAAELEVTWIDPQGRIRWKVVFLAELPSLVRGRLGERRHGWRNDP